MSAALQSAPFKLSFEINALPKITTNANSSWKARWVEARRWHRLVDEVVTYTHQQPPQPILKAHVILTRFAFGRRPDSDNLRSSFKHVLDALVKSQVLVDDSHAVIGEPEVYWEPAKPKQGKIRVSLWESR